MASIESTISPGSESFQANRAGMLALIERVRGYEQRSAPTSARSRERFEKRGQLLPRERAVAAARPGRALPRDRLAGRPGAGQARARPERAGRRRHRRHRLGLGRARAWSTLPIRASMPARCSPWASTRRCACRSSRWRTSCPTCSWSRAPAPTCMTYRVEEFVHGGSLFRNLARMSAAGLPVLTVTHGSSTAGGAYQTGLSDYIVMVRGRSRAFLAGPPLLKAATGEIATEEELGGAVMHTSISGLGDYLAEDDRDAIRIAREILAQHRLEPRPAGRAAAPLQAAALRRRGAAGHHAAWTPSARSTCGEVIARIADDSEFLDFGEDYGGATVCGHVKIEGLPLGIVTNNGPIDPRRRQQGHALHPGLLPGEDADPLPQQHDRLHGRHGARGGRHDQARLQDDPGRDQRHRAADHASTAAPPSAPATTACAGAASIRASASRGPTRARR